MDPSAAPGLLTAPSAPRRRPALPRWLAAALALALAGCGAEEAETPRPPPVSPPAATWDLRRLPPAPAPVGEWTTPEGVRVLRLEAGRGEPAGPDTPMDVSFDGYLLSGHHFAQAATAINGEGLRLATLLPAGLRPAFEGLRQGERRRVLVPSAQAFGHERPTPEVPPGSDVVYDVVRRDFEIVELQAGAGREAREGAWVTLHFRGRTAEGLEFEDTRRARDGQPIARTLREGEGGFLPGFARGLVGLRVGGMRRVHVPARLGFGARAVQVSEGVRLPPHSDLVFVLELLDVADAPPAEPRGRRP